MSSASEFREKHHYLAQSYLKAWTGEDGRLSLYRLLVPHERVHVWRRKSPAGVAYHRHLYTRLIEGAASDEFEIWLEEEVEGPAQEALAKVRADQRLEARDWKRLMRFIAAHDVRTPARYIEMMERLGREMPEMIQEVLRSSVKKVERAQESGRRLDVQPTPDADRIPIRVMTEIEEGSDMGRLGAEVTMGRSLWLFLIRRVLEQTYRELWKRRWSVLPPPSNSEWFTSDQPVVRLNYYGPGSYDFKGGWGNKGSEILFPISPERLLYTKVGDRARIHSLDDQLAGRLQELLAEHAFRYIYASEPLARVEKLRPRVVDRERYSQERAAWDDWHADQSGTELEEGPER